MSETGEASPSPRNSANEKPHESPVPNVAENLGSQKHADTVPTLDVKALTDRALHFLATATNETLGACLVGLGAGTYLILGRVGLVLIGVVGGVVLHATWEGHTPIADARENHGKSAQASRRERGVDVARRLLDWRETKTPEQSEGDDDASDLDVRLYSGEKLDYSDFKPETAAALTELTDAVIRDYVKYGLDMLLRYLSNVMQVVVLARPTQRRIVSRLVSPNLYCIHALRVIASVT